MTDAEVEFARAELQRQYAGCHMKVAEDKGELVAEISDGFAVAVIERSVPHFHQQMVEAYRVLRGTLLVARAGHGHVLNPGDSISIERGQIHFARSAGGPAWIEVRSEPPWSAGDHFAL